MQLKNDDQNVFQGLHFVNMFKKTIAFVIICDQITCHFCKVRKMLAFSINKDCKSKLLLVLEGR